MSIHGMSVGSIAVFAAALFAQGAAVFTQDAAAVEVVVVCPPQWERSLDRWIDHRRDQGLRTAVIAPREDVSETGTAIAAAADASTRYVLLVGDAPTIHRNVRPGQIPTRYVRSTVTARFGSTETIASDFALGDFNDDGQVDAAVGRLPVQTEDQLSEAIDKIIDYETGNDFGSWRREVQLVGGVGGFGTLIDTAIESVTRGIVTGVLPSSVRTHITFASPGHRFFPRGDSFTSAVLDDYRRGARFWVYAGHGRVAELDRVPATATGVPVLDAETVKLLQQDGAGPPLALLLACWTGAIDAPESSIAESMWSAPAGPVVVIAGSRVTMPYGNAALTVALIDAIYEDDAARIGDAWRSTLNELAREDFSAGSATRTLIEGAAGLLGPPGVDVAEERREHRRLYNLIGDPTVQLFPPRRCAVSVVRGDPAGQLSVTVASPIAGDVTIDIDRPLGAVIEGDPNKVTLKSTTQSVAMGEPITADFDEVPAGPVIVRVLVRGTFDWATGAAKALVRDR